MKIRFKKLKTLSEKPWFYPVALFLMAVITYGYALTSLGYYWSDWEVVFFTQLDPALQFSYYAIDRPYPWTYQLVYFLVGTHPLGWHIVTLLLRWAGTLFFVYALIQFWPAYRRQIFWLGALLMVYPGFIQQGSAAAYSRHIMSLLLFTLSLYLMALAIRQPTLARLFFPLSWLVIFAHLFTIEYFSGMEFIRPVLIWVLVANVNKKDAQLLRKVALYALPYVLITAFFLWARFVYFPAVFQTAGHLKHIDSTLGQLHDSFIETLLSLFNRALQDLLYATTRVWTDSIIGFDGFTFERTIAWFAFGVGALFAVAFALYYDPNEEEASSRSAPIVMVFIGFLMFVAGALPIWAIGKGLSIGGGGSNERFILAPMFGTTLMVVGLALLFVRPAGQKWLFGFLLMFSVATQIWLVNVYRRDWKTQTNYYWQLYWRIPALQSNTAILSYEFPSGLITHDLDASWAVNLLYHARVQQDRSMPYMFFTPEQEFYFQPNTALREQVRNMEFNGNTSDNVAVLHPTGDTCLLVLDPIYMNSPLLDEANKKLISISDPSRIIPGSESASPDTNIFSPEPAHTWCYFFEKADFARQIKDWNEVVDLYQQAQKLGEKPQYGAEYIPFIEAFAQTGDWQKAYNLTMAADKITPRPGHKRLLCRNWAHLAQITSADLMIVERVAQNLVC